MVDAYKLCPDNPTFPAVYGITDGGSWDYGASAQVNSNWIDVSYDGRFIVSGGHIRWNKKEFLPAAYFKEDFFPGFSYAGQPDDSSTDGEWRKGLFQLYVEGSYDSRKFFLLGTPDFHLDIASCKLL